MSDGVTSPTTVRPLQPDDVEAAAEVQLRAFAALDAAEGRTPEPVTEQGRTWSQRRIAHLQSTDPHGTWVAERDGEVVGCALALRRGAVWFLSLLVVDPPAQSAGTGAQLLAASLRTAEGARGAYLCSSGDPRALRRYARAGFALLPGYDASGPVDRAQLAAVQGVRDGDWGRDGALLDDLGTRLRGAPYGPELDLWQREDRRVLVADGGAAVLGVGGRLTVLGARDEATAVRLLQAVLAEAGETAEVDCLTAAQQWAVPVLLDAGLRLRPGTSLAVRGELGALTPFVPSGAYG